MNKLNLLILPWEKRLKNKQKQSRIKEKNKFDALGDLKPKEIKPREIKPNRYSDYFIDEVARIRECYEPVDFNKLIYHFKNSKIPSVSFSKFKGRLLTLKAYIMVKFH